MRRLKMTHSPCGNCRVADSESLILQVFGGLFDGNGVVFLWKVRWISFIGSGDRNNAMEFENEGFAVQKIQSAKNLIV